MLCFRLSSVLQTYADKHAPALFYGDDESTGAPPRTLCSIVHYISMFTNPCCSRNA
jgi:hypothetical protein